MFVTALVCKGFMDENESQTYMLLHGHLYWEPDRFVYLSLPKEICRFRVKSRRQPEDIFVSIEQLELFETLHKQSKVSDDIVVDASTMCPEALASAVLTALGFRATATRTRSASV